MTPRVIAADDEALEASPISRRGRWAAAGRLAVRRVTLPLAGNARAKMQGHYDGFVKLFCLPTTGIIVGGVVVAPGASELIYSLSLCVSARLTVDQAARAFTVFPSLSGSISEAGRQLHSVEDAGL